MKYSVLFAALLALAVTACEQKKPEEAAPAPTIEQSAPADQPAAPAEQSAAPADQSAAEAAPAVTSSAAMPTECDEYFKAVTTCVDKMGAAGEQFKQAMEQSKAQWASMSDPVALAAACKQAADAFAASSKAMGC